jgi:hypothetical protein
VVEVSCEEAQISFSAFSTSFAMVIPTEETDLKLRALFYNRNKGRGTANNGASNRPRASRTAITCSANPISRSFFPARYGFPNFFRRFLEIF